MKRRLRRRTWELGVRVVRQVRGDDEDSNRLSPVELAGDILVGLGNQHCGPCEESL